MEPTPTPQQPPQPVPKKPVRHAVSAVLTDGSLAELVLDPADQRTRFAVFRGGEVRLEAEVKVAGERIVPYAATNNLLRHGVVLFPSAAEEYGTEGELLAEIQAFLHRYVDLTPTYEAIAAHYVLLTWLYDDFHEVPYLRVRGDAGSGKTRFLLTVGSLCYKPIFASGASTVSPLFRIIDAFRGTLILDESDFRLSDEKAEIVKILNNGNARGFPVLRSEVMKSGEVNPTAFAVFGPKLIATRGFFEDRALETRCITEELGQYRLRTDIPINVSADMAEEALSLRNRLLMFRFRNRGKRAPPPVLADGTLAPRLSQIFAPLLAMIDSGVTRGEVLELAKRMHGDFVADRGLEMEAQVLQVVRDLAVSGTGDLGIAEIARHFASRFSDEYDRPMTPKWIGFIVRRKLRLRTEKHHGVFVIAPTERPKLDQLFAKYGLTPDRPSGGNVARGEWPGDLGDVGDVPREGPSAETP